MARPLNTDIRPDAAPLASCWFQWNHQPGLEGGEVRLWHRLRTRDAGTKAAPALTSGAKTV
ncbi:uncharacterized protein N7473_007214 [Penicillium subrubescens]|uniref:uncharacterized protein n=1 Tax=Penicillium subrubescens TaxID=1316194 RepID=UPI00254590A3|nr:uncharacterized protein N7473_007214 [Penicillium subrubescens]KAJ5890986.1 hypothetical protein N7473_007214 [Penicillium subrubescens]